MSIENYCQVLTSVTCDLLTEQITEALDDFSKQMAKSMAYIRVYLEAIDVRLEYLNSGIHSQGTATSE